ncbi:unnamed protein product, partial [Notodromas monacha]
CDFFFLKSENAVTIPKTVEMSRVRLWGILLAFLAINENFCDAVNYMQWNCDKTPDTITNSMKTPGDNGFKIYVTGNPSAYSPGKAYTVNIEGQRYQYGSQKFLGFMLVAQPEGYHAGGIVDVGRFELTGDAMTTYSRKCQNAVTHTNIVPKTEVSVRWKAPSSASGCVMFKLSFFSRFLVKNRLTNPQGAMVIERQNVWYMDDGSLQLELCPDVAGAVELPPAVLDECQACGEAKYEVWEAGGYASEGLKQVALYGITRGLEGELKKHSRHIRTIIKARGLWHPKVTGKTYAVFRVDRKHHLMTLVSMLGPSPDWLVGVSSLELCQKNGTWAREKVIDLYPYDAGVDAGISYEDNDSPNPEAQKIRKITSSWPDNPRSPFFDHSGTPMKPLAILTVRRQKEYEKSDCGSRSGGSGGRYSKDRPPKNRSKGKNKGKQGGFISASDPIMVLGNADSSGTHMYDNERSGAFHPADPVIDDGMHFVETPDNSGDALRPECATTLWSTYSQCSVTCGDGLRRRSRMYQNPTKAQRSECNRQLEETEMCRGVYPACNSIGQPIYPASFDDPMAERLGSPNGRDYDDDDDDENRPDDGFDGADKDYNKRCATTAWSNWSPCSVTCGHGGVRTRTRSYHYPRGIKVCKEVVKEEMECDGPVPECPDDGSADHLSRPECAVTPWSYWSPCSVSCGKGVSVRTRMYVDEILGTRSCNVQLLETADCNGTSPQCFFTEQTALDDSRRIPAESEYCERAKSARNVHEFLQFEYWCKLSRRRQRRSKAKRGTSAKPNDSLVLPTASHPPRFLQQHRSTFDLTSLYLELEDETYRDETCLLAQAKGPCRGTYSRWFYDAETKSCMEFNYGGCKGNGNNFLTYNECTKKCQMTLAGAGSHNVGIQSHQNQHHQQPNAGFSSKKRMLMQQAMMKEKHMAMQKQNRRNNNNNHNDFDLNAGENNFSNPDLSWMDDVGNDGNYVTGMKMNPGSEDDRAAPPKSPGRDLYKMLGEMSYKQGGGHLFKSSMMSGGQQQNCELPLCREYLRNYFN